MKNIQIKILLILFLLLVNGIKLSAQSDQSQKDALISKIDFLTLKTKNIFTDDTIKYTGVYDRMLYTGIVDFGSDTVMVLRKSEGLNIANQIISHKDIRTRFALSLTRLDALVDVYIESVHNNEIQSSIMVNQQAQIANLEERNNATSKENARLIEVVKKSKNRSLFTGLGIGVGIGVTGTALIIATSK